MLFIFATQGYSRYRVYLPLFFLLLYYLKITGLRIPPLKFVVLGFLVIILSIPLKEIGMTVRAGLSVDLAKVGEKSVVSLFSGEAGDMALIEQSAAMIGNMDSKNKIFYGETYTPILFFAVPRSIWKEKPKLNAWQFEISDSGRKFGEMGQVSLVSGEAYANFRYLGIVIILFLLGRFYSFLYNSYVNLNAKHKGFLLLLLFNMIMFQVWRDGLISLFLFPFLNYLPIIGLYFIKKHHKFNSFKAIRHDKKIVAHKLQILSK